MLFPPCTINHFSHVPYNSLHSCKGNAKAGDRIEKLNRNELFLPDLMSLLTDFPLKRLQFFLHPDNFTKILALSEITLFL